MAGARMVFAYLGGFAVVVLAGSLLENAETDAQAFLYLALISGALATLVLWLCFWLCREPEEVGGAPAALSLKQSFSGMAQNTPFLIVFASILLMVLGTTVIGKTVLYYFEYQLGDRDAGSSALMAFAATGLLVIPFWTFVTLKTSKRFVWMAGSACAGVALLAFLVNPATSVAMVTWNYVAIGFGTGAFAVTFWGMLPDTVEYGEWKTGDRVEAMIFGFITFAQKAAVALSAIILGLLLDFIGYQAGALQSAQTLDGLRNIIVGVPLFGILASVACMVYYPLSPKRHADIVAELAAR
jgi:GPH family glycoside/pentoside/hexuronide:cation symporter